MTNFTKSVLLLFILLSSIGSSWAETITVGTGTSVARYPLLDESAYSRSQMLFLSSEITTYGLITHLRWFRSDEVADPNAIGTTEIWLKETTNTTLSGTSWTDPGTLVATISNLNISEGSGWKEINIADFDFHANQNLLVSVRTQNAPATDPASQWRYTQTASANKARLGKSNTVNPPTMALSRNRPNIQFEFFKPSIKGIVKSATTNIPISGATIQAGTYLPAISAINGFYEIQGVTAGTYNVAATASGFNPILIEDVEVLSTVSSTLNIALTEMPFVSGIVTSATTFGPIEGARIQVGTEITFTAIDGSYKVFLPSGIYEVTASAPGFYLSIIENVEVSATVPNTLNIALNELPFISGILTSSMTSNPIVGAKVQTGTEIAFTASDGSYKIPLLPGNYDFAASAPGFNPALIEDVEVSATITNTLNIALHSPTLVVTPLLIVENLNKGETSTREMTICNNGDGPMDWSASIEVTGKNTEKLEDITKVAPNGSRFNPLDPKSGALWDNSNINVTPNYTFQCVDLTGKIPDGRSILADDFIVPPLETWTIKNVFSNGYSDKVILPDAFAVEFYADNNGLPGNLIYTEDIVPSDINFATQNLDLATPLVLNEGHYWIAVYAVYNGATGTNTTVWYWSTGTVPIGNNIAYNDFGNIWGFSSWGWFHLDIFGAQKPSCYFIINGDKAGAFGLSETSGTILPGECQVITLAFDATILTQGTYQATLTFNSDPDVGQVELPLTLNVLSEVNGVVTDANTGLPHANAEVTFAGYNPVFTGLDGVYTLGVLPGEYAATVQADGYCDLTVSNIIVGDISLVQDFLLTGPLFSIEPTPIEKNLDYGTVIGTSEVMVSNPGTCDLPFTSSESAEWLAVNPSNGIIPAGGNVVLTFTYNPTGLFYGSYEATLDFELGVITDQSVNVKLSIAQEIMIPAANQWGGISTYVDVNAKGASSIEALLAEILDNMVILIGEEGIFWPGQNLNTIGNWNNNFGYKIKMSGNDELFFDGTPVTNKTATYSAGIHIIPVLSNAAVSTQAIFGGKPIEFAFSFDGNVYWPNGGINTLNQLLPGFAYLVRFNDITTLDFEVKGGSAANNPPVHINTTNWNDVTRSGDVHIVSLPAKASADLREGDVLGVFNSVGTCTGMSEFDGSNLALVVYGNDMTTVETDGMNTGDFMMYKVFRNGEEFETSVTYSPQMPNYDGTYADNGLSMITNLKLGALAVSENPMAGISIYPNPSTGVFNINMNGSKQTIGMVVSNAKGQVIYKTQMNVSQQFDLSSQPNGVYFLRLIGENSVRLEKLIVK